MNGQDLVKRLPTSSGEGVAGLRLTTCPSMQANGAVKEIVVLFKGPAAPPTYMVAHLLRVLSHVCTSLVPPNTHEFPKKKTRHEEKSGQEKPMPCNLLLVVKTAWSVDSRLPGVGGD